MHVTNHIICLDPSKFNEGQPDKIPSEPCFKTVCLDWLEIFGEALNVEISEEPVQLENEIVLRHCGHGTSMFNDLIEVYYYGEKAAYLQVNPRFIKGAMKEKSAQLKFENHLLYADYFIDFYSDLSASIEFRLNNFTRVDIAIDNCQNVKDFLNEYNNQSAGNIEYLHKGKARFSSLGLDKKTMNYNQFLVGTAKSEKQISVYNKSVELEQSNKQYIRDFWKKNGVEDTGEVFRVEMRLKGKYLKTVKDLSFANLADSTFLASLFRTAAANFFEFVHNSDSNISRADTVELIPYDELGGDLLEREKKPERDDIYKAKMTVHYLIKMIILGKVSREAELASYRLILDTCRRYRLESWYENKAWRWQETYGKFRRNEEKKAAFSTH